MSAATLTSSAAALALPFLRTMSPRRVIAFNYHAVAERPPPVVKHLVDCKTPRAFARDLAFLQGSYRFAEYGALADQLSGRQTLPQRSVILTFDDGLAECHSIVRPILQREGAPCVFFVVKDLIDNRSLMFRHKVSLCLDALSLLGEEQLSQACDTARRELGAQARVAPELASWARGLRYRDVATIDELCLMLDVDVERFLEEQTPYMTSGEIRDLHNDGFTIGGHSCDHPELWLLDRDEVERQIVESCSAVRELTGQETVPFSFPFWGSGIDRGALASLLQEHPWIDVLFDTNDLAIDRPFIMNRLNGDDVAGATADATNLHVTLARAHAIQPLRVLKRIAAGAVAR